MNLYTSMLIPNLEKAFMGEEVRSSVITALKSVNEEHYKKMRNLHPYGPGDDDPEGHIIEDE